MSGSKLGKGGGRGTGRMVVAPPPPLGRGMAMPMRRQVMGPKQKGTGMGKGRLGSAGGSGLAVVAPSQEESFQVLSLDQGRAPFAMAIRLTPEVFEDLKRAEAEDVKCEMKFGITPSGHVRLSFSMPFVVSECAIFLDCRVLWPTRTIDSCIISSSPHSSSPCLIPSTVVELCIVRGCTIGCTRHILFNVFLQWH